VLGYALLGAGWLVMKCDGELREWARQRIPWLAIAVMIVLLWAFGAALVNRAQIGVELAGRAWGLVFPVLSLLTMAGIFLGVHWRYDSMPFAMTVGFFIAAFLTLAVLFWPYIIAESTRKLVGILFELQDLGAKDLKGISGRVRAWAALSPRSIVQRNDIMGEITKTRDSEFCRWVDALYDEI